MTWNEAAQSKLRMYGKGKDLTFDGGIFTAHFAEISRCVRLGETENIHHWVKCIGYEAARGLQSLGLWDEEQLLALLVRKQSDYGHENIMSFGITGVGIRVCDKIARYYNLVNRTEEAENEPFNDCLVDMVGYAVVAAMLEDETFILELE